MKTRLREVNMSSRTEGHRDADLGDQRERLLRDSDGFRKHSFESVQSGP